MTGHNIFYGTNYLAWYGSNAHLQICIPLEDAAAAAEEEEEEEESEEQ